MLRVVEVHRTPAGDWELVDGGTKPAAAALAVTPATRRPAVLPPPLAPPTFKPLAELFAECLQHDSQLNAAFEGAPPSRRPLCAWLSAGCRLRARLSPAAAAPCHPFPASNIPLPLPTHCSGARGNRVSGVPVPGGPCGGTPGDQPACPATRPGGIARSGPGSGGPGGGRSSALARPQRAPGSERWGGGADAAPVAPPAGRRPDGGAGERNATRLPAQRRAAVRDGAAAALPTAALPAAAGARHPQQRSSAAVDGACGGSGGARPRRDAIAVAARLVQQAGPSLAAAAQPAAAAAALCA